MLSKNMGLKPYRMPLATLWLTPPGRGEFDRYFEQ